jgi:hypothetical protein
MDFGYTSTNLRTGQMHVEIMVDETAKGTTFF